LPWEVRPLIGVGPVDFGISRREVRDILGEPSRLFKKTPEAVPLTDEYSALGIHIYYGSDDRLEFVEGWSEAHATNWRPEWKGVRFFDLGLGATLIALQRLGVKVTADALGGYDCWSIGVSLYVPSELEGVACYSAAYRQILQANRSGLTSGPPKLA
jgi:hypothetical protein